MLRILLLLLLAPLAQAAEPPLTPILRIDPGEHTALIRRIATDAAGRWLVTAGEDKAARVWDLADGRLLLTLRPPLGMGNEGKLNAVALSPDGRTVALGGWTQFNNGSNKNADDGNTVYFFDRASGRLLRRITGLSNVIQHVAYSPDGRLLAVTLFGNQNGLRVFNVADGSLFDEDHDYGADSYSAQFSPDGRRLLTSSYDGFIRLYRVDAEGITLLLKRAVPGGKILEGARFSPDGRRIAVGFDDSYAVNVLDADDLQLLYAPDTSGVTGKLSSLAWSRDGAWLYAAGQAQRQFNGQWRDYIRRWAVHDSQTGPPTDWPVAGDVIMDLVPLVDGRLVFGSGAPAWGVVSATGQRRLFHTPPVADFRGNQEGFTLSADAAQVRFGYELWGKSPAVFDSQSRALRNGEGSGLQAPRIAAPGLEISDWKHTVNPKLNGQLIPLYQSEQARCVALRPDDSGFVLGASWSLRAFDRDGHPTWVQPVPGTTWAVNISQDNRWVVAAYGDGTIRWHRASDGVEVMAFYPHPDKKRWVLWTPSGYFDASPGAEDLIGWHINNGKTVAADFFPASRFRDRFYRPDVVAHILETGDEAEAVRLANAEAGRRTQATNIVAVLPPVLRLLGPNEGERFTQVRQVLRYTVRTAADAPVTGVKVLVDGRPLNQARGLQPRPGGGEQEYSLEVTLPEHDVSVALIAENRHGSSVAQSVNLAWAGSARQEFSVKPKLYVLAVGISEYQRKDLKLNFAAKDARDFAHALEAQKGRLYREVEVKLLTDAAASRDEVVDGLDWLQKQVGARDVGMLFLAGHGVNDPTGTYYYLPHNADPDKLKRTGVVFSDIRNTMNALAGKSLFFVDTCHAGNVIGDGRRSADMNAVVNELASAENGVVVFSSATGREYALENEQWGNGAFTKALVEGLSGKADVNKSGRITHKMLDFYLSERVKELTRGQQHPVTLAPQGVPDFPIATVK